MQSLLFRFRLYVIGQAPLNKFSSPSRKSCCRRQRASVRGKPRILYLSSTDVSLGVLLAQEDERGRSGTARVLSLLVLVPAEQRYSKVDKACLALVFAANKLRQTMLAHLKTKSDPQLLSRPSGRAALLK